ncbi:MAG: T9SS type A sorting domain-containing protein [Saprospiraceae bacterium]|nr:T9SS type A sorting domain-containing protein [Saprospiraceae bacterium]
MKRLLFLLLLWAGAMLQLNAQDNIILDFETPETSTSFSYFDNGDWPDPTTSIVVNPDKSGINTSDSVLYFVRGVGGQTWAGAYGNPAPTRPIDLTTHNRLKCKVWAEKPGTVQLKLEGGPAGEADNWERVIPIPATGQWVDMEWDVTLPGEAGQKVPAFGKVYKNIVIFANFLEETTERVYLYFDDFATGEGEAAQPVPVTFVLNAAGYNGSISSASVAGTFNGWDAAASPMTEVSSGSKLYSVTVDVLPGVIEYKFVLNGNTWEEGLSPLDECIVNNNGFINRKASISGETNLIPVCWNRCYNCGEDVDINVNIGFGAANPPSPDGVWIAGGAKFEAPGGKYKMEDPDGDGIYSITINRGIGFATHFTFANGNCPDYSCKEHLDNQDCGDGNNYWDRKMLPVTQDTSFTVCFGDCSQASCAASTKFLKDAGFSISPNPGVSLITLKFDQYLQENGYITISGILGNVVKKVAFTPGTQSVNIDINSLTPGIYTASYIKKGKVGTKLFIKN